ncbi:DUF4365 domain-containing protein [Herbaspirillum aquaticum]|uniref:DUF4365 domain-containing protein n=1 Tax=Herbaspirillum aquaticum TaxID=568783 RepID=UPI0024DECBCC|nr:DUF4365 domain-containing protein [Herbaspirillum aquaticum]
MPEDYSVLPGPKRSRAQKIGDIARAALHANKPDEWELGEFGGDDYGYDYQVYVLAPENSSVQCIINIQLKGTTQKGAKINEGSALTYPFDKGTLNMWHRSGTAVLVVIVDLIETLDPKVAKAHYYFASPDLGDILDALPAAQQTVRLHVPIANEIHQKLDVLPVVLPYLDSIREAQKIARERLRASGSTTTEQIKLEVLSAQVNLVDQLIDEREIDNFIHASGKKEFLEQVLAILRRGDFEDLLEKCPAPEDEQIAVDPHSAALSLHLRSLALDAIGDDQSSADAVTKALELFPECDPIVGGFAHKEMVAIPFGPDYSAQRNALLAKLDHHKGLAVTIVKAKLHSLNGDFDQARTSLNGFSYEKKAIVLASISIVEQDWKRAYAETEKAKELPDLRPRQQLSLQIFEARALFEMAISAVKRLGNGELVIPPSGLPGIDYALLKSAFEASRTAMMQAQRLNWPSDISYVIDVYPVSAMVLGVLDSAIPLLAALGLARARITSIREALTKVFVQSGRPELALAMRDNAGAAKRFENEDLVMAVAALKAGRPEEAFVAVTDEMLSSDSSTDLYLSSLMLIGIAADASLRTDLVTKIKTRLANSTAGQHFDVIMDSAIRVQQSILQRPDAIRVVYDYWTQNGNPPVIGLHLLNNLNPLDKAEAELFLTIVEETRKTNSLDEENYIDEGLSLLTLEKTAEAESVLREAEVRFVDNPKIKSLLGIALEKNGKPHDAFVLFEQLLNNGSASESARRYYVEIAVRMGFFDRAETQVRAVLAKTQDRERKLQLLGTLIQLLLAEGNRLSDTEAAAWQFGRFARQDDEKEEGIFLQQYLVASAPNDLKIPPERIEEFQQRLNAYTKAFPNSKVLWSARMPENPGAGEFEKALLEALRISPEDVKRSNAVEKRLDQGTLLVPFSWRPRQFLPNITDIFMLWEMQRKSPIERMAMHFANSVAGYEANKPADLSNQIPVISLTTLLLLDELNLLERVLNSFKQVILARSTLLTLQQTKNSFATSWGRARSERIMELLQRHFAKVTHPPQISHRNTQRTPAWYEEEKLALRSNNTVYFSDDIVETHLTCFQDDQKQRAPSITTVNFLSWLDEQIGTDEMAREVAVALAKMIDLRIMGVNVELRYFIAAMPPALASVTTEAQANEIASNDSTFLSMVDGLWGHEKDFDQICAHFAGVVIHLLTTSNVSEESLVYLWLRWLRAIRLQTQPAVPPARKVSISFFTILSRLPEQREFIEKLWRALWTVMQRGFTSDELGMAADKFSILEVANVLGNARAGSDNEEVAKSLYARAQLGLEAGTERSQWLNDAYVNTAAQAALLQQKKA